MLPRYRIKHAVASCFRAGLSVIAGLCFHKLIYSSIPLTRTICIM